MSSTLALSVGAFIGTMVVAVAVALYVEWRLKDLACHLEELYGQLEIILWKLE